RSRSSHASLTDLFPDPAHDGVRHLPLVCLEPMPGATDHQTGERPGSHGVLAEGLDERFGPAVEGLVAASDDGRDRDPHRLETRPSRALSIVLEHVLVLARPIETDVAAGAPVAPGARDERLRASSG